jgi:chromosome segregation ATPase
VDGDVLDQFGQLWERIGGLERDLAAARVDLKQALREIKALREAESTLTGLLRKREAEIVALKQERASNQAEIIALRKTLDSNRRRLASLEKQISGRP